MIVKLTKKQMYRKCVVLLVCLVVVVNSAQGTVLCFGADGHVELESAFHEHCDHSVHSHTSDRNQLSYETSHERGEHCRPCVDVPISFGLAKISPVTKQLNPAFPVPAANVIVLADNIGSSENNYISNAFFDTSYFTPLRTVILLA
jgi:hypothetical protein